MDCKTARMLLCFSGQRPGELDADEFRALEAHLAACTDCSLMAETEKSVDVHLGRAIRDVPVPEGLRTTLLAKLGAERDAFYRRWLFRAAGVAALLVLSAWLGWWWLHRPAPFDLAEVQEQVGAPYRATKEQVAAWLQRVGGPHLTAPADFQYESSLVAWGQDEFNGRKAPYLFFAGVDRGGSPQWARVYVLDGRRFQFDLEDLRQQALSLSGANGVHAQIVEGEDDRVAYAVFHTGFSLEWFLRSGVIAKKLGGAANSEIRQSESNVSG
jgi:hypothetical protein